MEFLYCPSTALGMTLRLCKLIVNLSRIFRQYWSGRLKREKAIEPSPDWRENPFLFLFKNKKDLEGKRDED